MKTQKGIKNYQLPHYSDVRQVFIKGKDYDCYIERVATLPMDDILGTPNYYYLDMNGQILIWPTPDKEYEIIVRYAPPLKEF